MWYMFPIRNATSCTTLHETFAQPQTNLDGAPPPPGTSAAHQGQMGQTPIQHRLAGCTTLGLHPASKGWMRARLIHPRRVTPIIRGPCTGRTSWGPAGPPTWPRNRLHSILHGNGNSFMKASTWAQDSCQCSRSHHNPGNFVEKPAHCRAFWRWLRIFNSYPEVA